MRAPPILSPLAIHDFRLLWAGMTVSLLGDGLYVVAIAWQVYELSNAPTALSVVGFAWTLPLLVFVLLGGVVSDRVERRRVMIAADLVRAAAIGTLGALSVAGVLELWHVVALVAVYGAGEAFFGPAFSALVPQLVPPEKLVQANSLDQLMRPLGFQLVGPAVGGLAIAGLGPGGAFLLDAGSFLVSAAFLARLAPRPLARGEAGLSSLRRDLAEGYRFVRGRAWIWMTLVAAAVALFAYWGPVEVLVPFVVKNELGGGADDLGFVFAAGGVGAILGALALSQRGMPHRHMTFLYLMWAASAAAIVGYGVVNELWQAMLVSLVSAACGTSALVVWMTLVHRLVPSEILGRVQSFDWLVSTALVPVSFAVTGPVAEAAGARETLVGAGAVSAALVVAFLFAPGVRDTERDAEVIAAIRHADATH